MLELDKKERLFLSLQYQILEKTDPDNAKYYERNRIAVENGYALHYEWLTEHIDEGLTEAQCKLVLDILDMYRAMHFAHKALGVKTQIKSDDIRFQGFDGNGESEYLGYVKYFVLDLERYTELLDSQKYPDFNSHCPMLDTYERMLEIWKDLPNRHRLSEREIHMLIGE